MKKALWKGIAQTAMAVLFLALLWLIAYVAVGNELIVPSLLACLKEMGRLLVASRFWTGFLHSLLRALVAFLISFGVAVVFGTIAYLSPTVRGLFAPVVSAFRSLPVLAVLLILLSVFSAGSAPVAVAFLSLFPMLYTAVLNALLSIDKGIIESAKVCGTPVLRRVFSLYLPLSAPSLLRETGAGLSFSLKLVVSAEVLANTAKSLGGMMQEAKIYAEIPTLFALVSVAFLVGLFVELLFSGLASLADKRIQ